MRDPDPEALNADIVEGVIKRAGDLRVMPQVELVTPDDVDIALIEFAIVPERWPLRPPHLVDLVVLQWEDEGVPVLGDVPGQRHSEVVAEAEALARPRLRRLNDLEGGLGVPAVGVLSATGELHLPRLHRRGVDRLESVVLEPGPDRGHDTLLKRGVRRLPLGKARQSRDKHAGR